MKDEGAREAIMRLAKEVEYLEEKLARASFGLAFLLEEIADNEGVKERCASFVKRKVAADPNTGDGYRCKDDIEHILGDG